MDRAVAASGVLVVAIDMTLAPEAPYPACVQDANYGVRWLKSKAAGWNGDSSKIGVFGSSRGGHVAELLGMRPRDKRYNAFPLPSAPNVDATVAYVATRSPISNTFARFKNAEEKKREGMIKNNTTFFVPWETIHEANPQEILERRALERRLERLLYAGFIERHPVLAHCLHQPCDFARGVHRGMHDHQTAHGIGVVRHVAVFALRVAHPQRQGPVGEVEPGQIGV